MKKNFNIKAIIYFIYLLIITLSIIYIIDFLLLKREAKKEINLLNSIVINQNKEEVINKIVIENEQIDLNSKENINEVKIENERISKVKELKKTNEDIVGWLEIANTDINYPVLQGSDNSYYMTHNYKKEKSKNGAIFLDKDYDWEKPSENLLIYGHNMNNGTMFQELLKYKSQEFYENHPIIRFTTQNEDSEYEIISVFKSKVYYKSEKDVFRYYYFINAKSEAEYDQFVKNAKSASLYKINKDAKYGEQLITLSTCSYHVKDGRFVIVGRKKN